MKYRQEGLVWQEMNFGVAKINGNSSITQSTKHLETDQTVSNVYAPKSLKMEHTKVEPLDFILSAMKTSPQSVSLLFFTQKNKKT